MQTLDLILIFASLSIGLLMGYLVIRFKKRQQLKMAHNIAEDLIQDALDQAQELKEAAQERCDDFQLEQTELLDLFSEELQKKINILKEEYEKKALNLNKELQRKKYFLSQKKQSFSKYENFFNQIQLKFNQSKKQQEKNHQSIVEKLEQAAGVQKEVIIQELTEKLKKETFTSVTKQMQRYEEDFLRESEKKARQILSLVIGRFERAHCPERGINNIIFPSEENMLRSLGKDFEFVEIIEKEIGVDLTPHKDRLFLNVSAFDPVRRELTRITCEKLMHEKNLNPERIKKLIFQSKKQLFKKIKIDGNRILKELKIENMHPEIRDKIGSLRYRYSFTQNQYFHVSEVGWLCGLLSAELDLNISDGRRAGLLHDVGKSMDHSIDGGHAVIGADFIEKRNEAPHIVHAVRAHHFDEQPQTDLAYLVIAADAISGARPGARKSTAESYTQKMFELEKVGLSFKEVQSTYILSAGREVRVIVDNNKVDDYRALELSKEIAQKIETECTYPGQIRVTVVRKTAAIQYAK